MITKRTGSREKFDREKLTKAILLANEEFTVVESERITQEQIEAVVTEVEQQVGVDDITSEELRDILITSLMGVNEYLAMYFMKYRISNKKEKLKAGNIKVKKRNGTYVPFDSNRIKGAIQSANREVTPEQQATDKEISKIIDSVKVKFAMSGVADIESIQDMVEKGLMDAGRYELVKRYILYRDTKKRIRNANTTDESVLSLVSYQNKEVMEENSNKNATLVSTQRDLIAGEVSKDLTRRVLLSEKISKAHDEGAIHFHDMDYFLQPIHNCCLINIGDMLDNGTVMNGKMIESPKSFQVACTVTTQIIAAVASSQYGGQSVDMRHLAPYLRKSEKKWRKRFERDGVTGELLETLVKNRLREECAAGIQTIQYQINTLMTTNGQTPFVTMFLYMDDSSEYKDEIAMIIEEVLKQRLEGIKNEAGVYITPPFPKLIYVLDKCNNLTGGAYDWLTELAVKCTAKRMYPDYISAKKMRENYEGNVFSPMGCRSFLSPWKDEEGNYKFEGRFNQGVVSLNLPQIGILARGDRYEFFRILEERLAICFEALMARHKHLLGTPSDVAPIMWQYGAIARLGKGEVIDPLLKDGYSTLSLGYIGLYEVTKLMTGETHTSEKGKKFAITLLQYLRSACDRWKIATGLGFGLYGTPAESLCYRFAKIDRERFGDIPDVTDKGYYTNSYHVDVREHIDAFSKFKFEAQFQPISSGGCISYVEIPNMSKNLEALAEMVRFIYDNIQYAEFNTKSDYCHVCGFDGEIVINDNNEWECPQCHNKDHSKMTVTRRTCGYLGSNYWNFGKTLEIKQRVLHIGSC